jgi:hypothetical protein
VLSELELGSEKEPNQQMDVVLALWEADLINTAPVVNCQEAPA